MEHWPTPDVFIDPVDVPYVSTEDYVDGDFSNYPLRKLDLHQADKLSRPFSWNELDLPVSFFQTWLFFGCVIEVFRVVGITVKTSDFRRPGDEYIRTHLLPKFIQLWIDFEASRSDRVRINPQGSAMPDDPRFNVSEADSYREDYPESRMETKDGRFEKIMQILNVVAECTKAHCPVNPESDLTIGQHQQLDSDSCDKVWLSIMALGTTLSHCASKIYKISSYLSVNQEKWGFSRILRERMLQRGWCKGVCVKFERDMDITALYYIGSVQSPRSGQCFDDCILRGCSGKTFSGTYQSQHCLKGCDCEQMEVNVDMVVDIIGRKKVPLISWDGTKMSVIEDDGNMKYVAISHVWSDGMGNESKNALPECQLNRIQGFIEELYSVIREESVHGRLFGPKRLLNAPTDPREGDPLEPPVGFWIDTLCVPVQDVHTSSRKQAILQMRSIYDGAHRVLVIDEWIRKLDRKASAYEKAARLYLSNWQSRLWTLQEGVLAQNLFFWFNDGPLTIDELIAEVSESLSVENFYTAPSTFLVRVPMVGSRLYFDKSVPAESASFLLLPLLDAIKDRTTSRMEDETICIATLLPYMNLANLLSIKKTGEGVGAEGKSIAEARMESFLLQIGSFDQSFIFNDLPRLQSEGYGWAPASYLGQSAHFVFSIRKGVVNPHGDFKKDALGLHVTFPGIQLQLFHFEKTDAERRINVVVRRRRHRYPYTLILQPPDKHLLSNRLNADASKQYALILLPGYASGVCSGRASKPGGRAEKAWLANWDASVANWNASGGRRTMAPMIDPVKKQSFAILGLLDSTDEESGRIRIWHVTRARLEWNPVEPPATSSDVVFGDWMKKQKWSVL